MNANVRRFILAIVFLLSLALVLAACQRERPAPEGEEGWTVSPVAGPTLTPGVVVPQPTLETLATTVSVEGITAATPLPGTLPTAVVPAETPAAAVVVPGGAIAAYTVQSGDTLFSVALQFDTDVETLRSLNNLSDDMLQVGQVLQVPAVVATGTQGSTAGTGTAGSVAATPQIQVVAGVEYVVQAGDTLSSIGESFGVAWQDIAATNNIAAPAYGIYRGQKLVIPGAQATPAPEAPGGQVIAGQTHTVQAGETLYSIAVQYGVTVQDIMDANNLANANLIYRGQELVIPAP